MRVWQPLRRWHRSTIVWSNLRSISSLLPVQCSVTRLVEVNEQFLRHVDHVRRITEHPGIQVELLWVKVLSMFLLAPITNGLTALMCVQMWPCLIHVYHISCEATTADWDVPLWFSMTSDISFRWVQLFFVCVVFVLRPDSFTSSPPFSNYWRLLHYTHRKTALFK